MQFFSIVEFGVLTHPYEISFRWERIRAHHEHKLTQGLEEAKSEVTVVPYVTQTVIVASIFPYTSSAYSNWQSVVPFSRVYHYSILIALY